MDITRVIARMVMGFPKTVLSVLLFLAILGASQLPYLETDPSPQLLAPEHESRVAMEKLRQAYTGTNSSIIVMLAAPQSIFNPETLTRIKKLTLAFEAINLITPEDRSILGTASAGYGGEIREKALALASANIDSDTWLLMDDLRQALEFVDVEDGELTGLLDQWFEKLFPVKKVSSLSSTDNILGQGNQLDVGPVYQDVPSTTQGLERVERQVGSNDMFQDLLISNNGKNTSINIELGLPETAMKERYLIYAQVKDILEQQIPGPETHYIAGLPVVTAALGQAMEKDSKKLFFIVILVVMTCLFITFRRLKGVLVPMTVVLFSVFVTLGLKSFLDIPLNIITISLPVFILSIGVADGIHMFSEYQDNLSKGLDKQGAVQQTIHHLAMPVIMTSLTTGAAFYAISMTKIVQLKHCGLFVCFGALVAMVFSLLFIPALLMVLPERSVEKRKQKKNHEFERMYSNFLIRITRLVTKKPVLTLCLAGTIFFVFLFGAFMVRVDNNSVHFFRSNSDIYVSSQALNREGAGSSRINFLISARTTDPEPFKDPKNLRYVRDLVAFLDSQPVVGKTMGLTQLIQRIYYALNDEKDGFNRLPVSEQLDTRSRNLISQLLLLYENGGGDALSDYANTSYDCLNLSVGLRTNSSRKTKAFTDGVRAHVSQNFPEHLDFEICGSANVEAATTNEIVKGQITGLTVSVLVVLLMLWVTFRRIKYTLIAMVPLVMTIVINFGVMGFWGIPLDIGTSIIASVVIGIGVDYSIHYLSRLRKNLDSGMEFASALDNTVSHSGKAIVSNAVTVGCGFLALWFSVLTPLKIMGWLITLTMVVSALCALVLLPVFFYLTMAKSMGKRSVAKSLNLTPEQG
ncbi:MAG: MMPL family transporter [Desulfobacula sp.]|nr:MMPL family transporter [Desulfobacula sp.]